MTEAELRRKFESAYRIIGRERRWRERVYRNDPIACGQKLAEIDELLGIVTELKDAYKPHCEQELEQTPLLDVPKQGGY